MSLLSHLIVAPILLPLTIAATMLLLNEKRRGVKRVLSLGTALALMLVAIALVYLVAHPEVTDFSRSYALGSWPAPFGIVLVIDRLSALMLLLTSVLGFVCLFYAVARWDRAGPRFHALFLLLMMGVNGAFLTADIFNLFVFFEVLLAASYGLALHGGGAARTTASLHYIAINIATSLLFLIGVAMVYSVAGTLNLADLASRASSIPAEDRALLRGGLSILGVAFLVKAGAWPLGFWLPRTYGEAAPPIAAFFAILSKVGIYIILRLTSLLFPEDPVFAVSAGEVLRIGGMATIVFGVVTALASPTLRRFAGYYLLISSGTLIAAIGFAGATIITGMLYYLVASTVGSAAFYLIIEPVERNSAAGEVSPDSGPVFEDEYVGASGEDVETEIGVAIPATVAVLGGGFILVALLLAGLPPLPSFIGKFALIDGLLKLDPDVGVSRWIMVGLLLVSGLAALITTTKVGIDLIWAPAERAPSRLSVIEATPIGLLLLTAIALVIGAGPVTEYMAAAADELGRPAFYIEAVQTYAQGAAR